MGFLDTFRGTTPKSTGLFLSTFQGKVDTDFEQAKAIIVKNESGGNYNALGTIIPSGM